VVPFVHWGPELVAEPRPADRALARKMIESGAAAVIGAHPHVTQTVDVHRGAPIVYSLGNFVFDYYPVDPPEWTGWLARLTFAKGRGVELETRAVVLDAAGLPRPAAED
jgi:poly-gamma-glutamate synthesis protein (capsule biosynthesis protein)